MLLKPTAPDYRHSRCFCRPKSGVGGKSQWRTASLKTTDSGSRNRDHEIWEGPDVASMSRWTIMLADQETAAMIVSSLAATGPHEARGDVIEKGGTRSGPTIMKGDADLTVRPKQQRAKILRHKCRKVPLAKEPGNNDSAHDYVDNAARKKE